MLGILPNTTLNQTLVVSDHITIQYYQNLFNAFKSSNFKDFTLQEKRKKKKKKKKKRNTSVVFKAFLYHAEFEKSNQIGLLHRQKNTLSCRNKNWLVGCFRLNGPLRQYFSLYRAVSQRQGERKRNDRREKKCPNNPHPHRLQAQKTLALL